MDTEKRAAFMQSVEIRILASVLGRLASRSIEERFAATSTDINGLQYGIMRTLAFRSVTLSDLSRSFVLDPSTLVPVIDALEHKGLISRRRDPNDRRRVPLSLTEKGAAMIKDVPLTHEEDLLFQCLQEMGEEKSAALLSLLREVVTKMPDGEFMVELIEQRLFAYQAGDANIHQLGHSCFTGEPNIRGTPDLDEQSSRERRRALRSRMRRRFSKRDV